MNQTVKLQMFPEMTQLTFEAAVQQIHELLRDESGTQWKIGQLYNYIVDNKLAEANGYRYAREFFASEFHDVGRSTLTMYGAVAKVFSEDISRVYGIAKLGRFLTYLKLSDQNLPEGDPGPFPIAVPRPDGQTADKPFADCTRDELASAIKLLRNPPATLPASDVELIERLQDALDELLGDHSHASVKGAWMDPVTELTLSHIPVAHLREVLAALTAATQS